MPPNNKAATFTPDFISPPGDTLNDVLEERGMTQAELSERTDVSRKTINEIIKGKAPISQDTALKLERVLGIPARFWNAREHQYREALAREEEADRLAGYSEWVDQFPIREMADLGCIEWIDGRAADAVQRRARALLDFFGVASPEQWKSVWLEPSAAFRRSIAFTSAPGAVSVWLRYGEREAVRNRENRPYDETSFRSTVEHIRSLTSEPPDVVRPQIVDRCAACGVAVVFTPQLPKSRVSGATQWLNPKLALIQLSLRYKSNDHFWFTFFHEAAHVLLHGKKDVFLEGVGDESKQHKEEEANEWATNFLISGRKMRAFIEKGDFSRQAVVDFADDVAIAPGIVVGQLQHRRVIRHDQLNDLKVRFEWRP